MSAAEKPEASGQYAGAEREYSVVFSFRSEALRDEEPIRDVLFNVARTLGAEPAESCRLVDLADFILDEVRALKRAVDEARGGPRGH